MKKLHIGSVHGRFQLFHNDHLRYITTALNECECIIIGITSYLHSDLRVMEKATHRAIPQNNPFTYYERTHMISSALSDYGVTYDKYSFTPFPIEQPELLDQFIPKYIPCFTTVYDDWNRQKISMLKKHGYEVKILWESKHKLIEGTVLRKAILAEDANWKKHVPNATIKAVKDLKIKKRLMI